MRLIVSFLDRRVGHIPTHALGQRAHAPDTGVERAHVDAPW
jgi:hypothetical protein